MPIDKEIRGTRPLATDNSLLTKPLKLLSSFSGFYIASIELFLYSKEEELKIFYLC